MTDHEQHAAVDGQPVPDPAKPAMKLDAPKLGLATGIVFAIVWAVGGIFMIALPGAMMRMGGGAMHAEMADYGWPMHGGGFLVGLVLSTVLPALIAWAVAAVYNRLVD